MTRWARLTWQAPDPAALAADLAHRLGVDIVRGQGAGMGFVLPLGSADLEIVPWRREAPADDPQPAGRLVFEPIEGGAPAPPPPEDEPPQLELEGVGWATVELDRAEAELGAWLAPAAESLAPAEDGAEPHLGGHTRPREAPGLPGEILVLSEPVTEGRLAASLARDGEGPCALYLRPREGLDAWLAAARRRGSVVSRAADGPFGRSVLLTGGAAGGPHVIVVAATRPSSARAPAGTIEP